MRSSNVGGYYFANTTNTAIQRLPGAAAHPDTGFGPSWYQADLSSTNEEGTPRPVVHTPRLYDPYFGLPGVSASQEGGRVVMLEPGGQYFQPLEQLQAYLGEGEDIRVTLHRKRNLSTLNN